MIALRSFSICALFVMLAATASPRPRQATSDLFAPGVARRLNAEITGIASRNNLPSVAVEIDVPGKGRYTYVRGRADLARPAPRRLAQPFRIASITKPFAATAILALVDEGRLRKNDAIAKWYPHFPNARKITIDDLLRMRSGIPAPNDDDVLAAVYDRPLRVASSLPKELATFARLKNAFKPPDTVGVYTDFNYDILAGIVQRVTGEGIGELITRRVIEPLDLRNTSYPTGFGFPGGLHGYGWNRGAKRFVDKTLFNPPLAGAAGAVVSSVADLEKFARVLCRGGLLKPQTQRERLRGRPLAGGGPEYGEGVALGHGFCGHSGTINGFSTDMYYVPKLDASLVISVTRLDRDNTSQSIPIYAAVARTMRAALGTP